MSTRRVEPRLPPPTDSTVGDFAAPPWRPANREFVPPSDIVVPADAVLMAHDPNNARCETVRALRTELMLRRDTSHDGADTVALLSPRSGEGRSLLAADLAIAFAQTGRLTLLVDADFRNPQQHVLFPFRNVRGLSQAIEFGMAPQLCAVENTPSLAVLTAGVLDRDPLELLSGQRFAQMIEEWRRTYSFVVIDTPPVGDYSDGLAIARATGRVLTLSRARRTPFRDMQDMLRRLAATRAQILGAVINHF